MMDCPIVCGWQRRPCYGPGCKHGVAVVLEYLRRVENNRGIPKAEQDDTVHIEPHLACVK